MSVIDEVKQKIDITEVVGQYVTLKKAGRNLTAPCPFHSEKHASFFVFPERQSWHCFGACATGGDVFAFLMKKEGIEFGEALRLLADKAGVTLPTRTEPGIKKEEKEDLYRASEAAALYFNNLLLNHPAAEKARNYVAKRGFTSKTIADFQLGFSLDAWEALKTHLLERGHSETNLLTAGLLYQGEDGKTHDRFRGKLMIPIRDSRGRVTGFGARVLDDSQPKYINSPQTPTFDKSATLYGIDRAAAEIRKQDTAIIMEGYMDVIMAHQCGVTNAVASMGTAITETQVNTLKKLTRNLVLSLDADAAGEEAMLRTVVFENTLNAEMRVILLPEGKDPDEVISEDIGKWQELVTKAAPLIDFMFKKTIANLDLKTAKDKSFVIERLLPIVAKIKEQTRQVHYIEQLARLLDVRVNDIQASLSQLKQPIAKKSATTVKQALNTRATKVLLSSSKEEYCLALLLQHPELKEHIAEVSPEYFESSENREIFNAYKMAPDVVSLKEQVDPAIHEHLDAIIKNVLYKTPTSEDIARRFTSCVLELEKRYYQNLEARRSEMFAHEVESGGKGADIVRLQKEGIEPSIKLRELYARRSRKHNSS